MEIKILILITILLTIISLIGIAISGIRVVKELINIEKGEFEDEI